ncbi:cell division protein FtsK [Actinomyces bowdenii]|uniref:FHA domain-containing protein n=1 Tax=Actinomyces bowdenii TaxID=131109 RepID=UPI001ABCBFA6|nr:FHA domain-containing protein [Actinomyces bowdenii]MBO3725621.1 cell division protein FtsK [Actinomyces bowdenii]
MVIAPAPSDAPTPPPSAAAPAPEGQDEGAQAARAARAALASRWHLAVLAGPDAGLVLPAGGARSIGRDGVLTDPLISRRHLRIRERDRWLLVRDAGSANGTRRRVGPLWLGLRGEARLGEGAQLRMGGTLVELRRRPLDLGVPAPPAPQSAIWMLVASLLCVGVMVVLGVVAMRTGSRGALGLVMLAPMVLMALMRLIPLLQARGPAGRRGREAQRARRQGLGRPGWRSGRPDPPTMLLALAARAPCRAAPGDRDSEGRAGGADEDALLGGSARGRGSRDPRDSLRAWTDRTGRRRVLSLRDGDCLALGGPAAHDTMAWWCAQVLARASARIRLRPGGVELVWGPPSRECSASMLVCRGDLVPTTALSVLRAPAEAPSCTPVWWLAACRLQGLADGPGGGPGGTGGVPEEVLLSEVVEELEGLDSGELAERWSTGAPERLEAVLGVGAHGPVRADLVRHGPHALLAGTTGSGKSELLVAWLLQLALGAPPSRLALVLVDYKGGAAFGPLARLPHTAGVLTDLDAAGTRRALSSLEAEVRRRERLLARHGVKDVSGLPARVVVPRLVVAVDEFAAMAAEHAEVLGSLVRVAAQGRSLGIHLILSTQRPQGAVSPAVRANTPLRVCLRVLDAGDSRDVLGHDGAARLPLHAGRVLVEGAPAPGAAGRSAQGMSVGAAPEQSAWPAEGRGGRGRQAAEVLQAPWCGPQERLAALVDRIAAAAAGGPAPWRPWAPALPARVGADQARALVAAPGGPGAPRSPGPPGGPAAPGAGGGGGGDRCHERGGGPCGDPAEAAVGPGPARGVVLALTDLPEEQRLGLWHWDMDAPLLVLGSPGSGRSTALATVAAQAAGAGVGVHLCGPPAGLLRAAVPGTGDEGGAGAPGAAPNGPPGMDPMGAMVGTAVGPEDPRRLARLWSLAASGALAGSLLCLDDVDALLPAVDQALGPGEGHALLESVLRTASATGTRLALCAPLASASARWAGSIGLRLVLGACTTAQASLAGLPHGVVTGAGAGRGAIVRAGRATACQVVLPPPWPASARARHPGTGSGRRGMPDESPHDPRSASGAPEGGRGPVRLVALPRRVEAGSTPPGTWALGGDEARPMILEPGLSVLVVGPPGSGRSTALEALRRALVELGRPEALGAQVIGTRVGGAQAIGASGAPEPASAAAVPGPGWRGQEQQAARGGLVVVDDLDRCEPGVQAAVEEALGRGATVLASATTERAAATYRGPLALLRERGAVVVLWPGLGPAAQVAGMGLRAVIDPRALTLPGRGALVHRGSCSPIQVVAPGPDPPS